MKKWIDLRSDTVTKPSPGMLEAMTRAEVGDDVFGEDPTVQSLEDVLAAQVEMEAGLFVPSGTQANLLGIMSHCERGDEYIAGQQAHTYKWEGGGAAILGSIQPQPVEFEADGTLDLELLKKYVKPVDDHFARTRLLCLENTQAGKVLPVTYLKNARKFAQDHQLRLHLDGARIFNAAIRLGVPVGDLTRHFDSVSVCLSKSLGAPVGSVLCGSKETIRKARRWRKVLGGGMRQAGVLAAAGLYALQQNVARLKVDHDNATMLAQELADLGELEVPLELVQTNMVHVRLRKKEPTQLTQALKDHGILVFPSNPMRLVTHLDISRQDIHTVAQTFKRLI